VADIIPVTIDGTEVPAGTGIVDQATISTLSGVEFLQGMMDDKFPVAPISQVMNLRLTEVKKGQAVFTATPTQQHLNPMGVVHGGFMATLLDSALGCAGQTLCEKGWASTSVELKVNFVRPVLPSTGRLICEANVVHPGRQLATVEAKIVGEADGKLYAHGTQTVSLFRIS